MSARGYSPGHYDGDGCVFPDIGHFAKEIDFRYLDLEGRIPGRLVEIRDEFAGDLVVILRAQRIFCAQMQSPNVARYPLHAKDRKLRGVVTIEDDDDVCIIQLSTVTRKRRASPKVMGELNQIMYRLIDARIALRSPGEYADDMTHLVRIRFADIALGGSELIDFAEKSEYLTIIGVKE